MTDVACQARQSIAPRIAIADDDPDIRAWIRARLRSLPIASVEVASGIELLELVADDPSIALVISDVHMPGLTGNHVTATVREAGLFVPVILVTAEPSAALAAIVSRLSGVLLLAKPLAAAPFLESVTGALAHVEAGPCAGPPGSLAPCAELGLAKRDTT